jgi:hypothetical protein
MSRLIALTLWLAMAGIACAQAAVEAAVGASRAVTTVAPAKGISKSMSGLGDQLEKALKPAQKDAAPARTAASSAAPATKVAAAAAVPPKPKVTYEDAAGIETGMAYDDVIRRFGPPAMQISSSAGSSLSYSGKSGMFDVTVQDGKVKSIEKPQP